MSLGYRCSKYINTFFKCSDTLKYNIQSLCNKFWHNKCRVVILLRFYKICYCRRQFCTNAIQILYSLCWILELLACINKTIESHNHTIRTKFLQKILLILYILIDSLYASSKLACGISYCYNILFKFLSKLTCTIIKCTLKIICYNIKRLMKMSQCLLQLG